MESKQPEQKTISSSSRKSLPTQIDIVEKSGRLYVNVELSGVRADEINVRISDGLLNLCTERDEFDLGLEHRCDKRFGEIIGNSKQFLDCLDSLLQASASDANVLLYGETGTGKELFARAIHRHSSRRQGNFVAVDCTVLPESIVGSLLFGHKIGSVTGADKTCEGLIRQAHHGTLFLDEVGELSPSLQKTFLRVLQENRFMPIGHKTEIVSDFRLVAATNRDLQRSTDSSQFRKDLLYRLQTYLIELPALRNRADDIEPLSRYHVNRLCQYHGLCAKQLAPEFILMLTRYTWPGNIRELINTLEQAIIIAKYETTLFPKHLPQHIRIQVARSEIRSKRSNIFARKPVTMTRPLPQLQDFRSGIFNMAEKQYLASLVQNTGDDFGQACRLSGLSRSRLYSLLKKHHLSLH